MPLPWKKTKVSKISRIVADFQPPNRGDSSLVVETGFPTSLVDLFVKNRERLKKSSKSKKSKKKKRELVEVEEEDVLAISDPIPLSSSRDLVDISRPVRFLELKNNPELENSGEESQSLCESQKLVTEYRSSVVNTTNHTNGNDMVGGVGVDGDVSKGGDSGGKERRVLVEVMKMFLVVVLALSTKKLAVGITMSAFVLILLEYVGEHVSRFLGPRSKARVVLEPVIRKVSFVFRVKRVALVLRGLKNHDDSMAGLIGREEEVEDDDDNYSVSNSFNLVKNLELRSPVEEIQVVETNLDVIARVEYQRTGANAERRTEPRCDSEWGTSLITKREVGVKQVEVDRSQVLMSEKERSRSAKIKSKILNKLVLKKLPGRKKGKRSKESETDLSSDASSCLGEGNLRRIEELEEEENGVKQDLEDTSKKLLAQLLEIEEEEEAEEAEEKTKVKGELKHASSSPSKKVKSGMSLVDVVQESVKIERKGSPAYHILLFVLAGLAGGRILALVLTVASCLMFKLVERRRGCAKKPTDISPAEILS